MILVDSCVWIDYLKGRESAGTLFVDRLIARADAELCVSGIIAFEVLRGVSEPGERKLVTRIFERLERRDYRHDSLAETLRYDLNCRRHGVTLSKLGDWLIVQTALDHDLELLTSDKDFRRIAPYVPVRLVPIAD